MSVRLREFRVRLDDDDLKRCERAGVSPGELVTTSVRAAIAELDDGAESVLPVVPVLPPEAEVADEEDDEEPEDVG